MLTQCISTDYKQIKVFKYGSENKTTMESSRSPRSLYIRQYSHIPSKHWESITLLLSVTTQKT